MLVHVEMWSCMLQTLHIMQLGGKGLTGGREAYWHTRGCLRSVLPRKTVINTLVEACSPVAVEQNMRWANAKMARVLLPEFPLVHRLTLGARVWAVQWHDALFANVQSMQVMLTAQQACCACNSKRDLVYLSLAEQDYLTETQRLLAASWAQTCSTALLYKRSLACTVGLLN